MINWCHYYCYERQVSRKKKRCGRRKTIFFEWTSFFFSIWLYLEMGKKYRISSWKGKLFFERDERMCSRFFGWFVTLLIIIIWLLWFPCLVMYLFQMVKWHNIFSNGVCTCGISPLRDTQGDVEKNEVINLKNIMCIFEREYEWRAYLTHVLSRHSWVKSMWPEVWLGLNCWNAWLSGIEWVTRWDA